MRYNRPGTLTGCPPALRYNGRNWQEIEEFCAGTARMYVRGELMDESLPIDTHKLVRSREGLFETLKPGMWVVRTNYVELNDVRTYNVSVTMREDQLRSICGEYARTTQQGHRSADASDPRLEMIWRRICDILNRASR